MDFYPFICFCTFFHAFYSLAMKTTSQNQRWGQLSLNSEATVSAKFKFESNIVSQLRWYRFMFEILTLFCQNLAHSWISRILNWCVKGGPTDGPTFLHEKIRGDSLKSCPYSEKDHKKMKMSKQRVKNLVRVQQN